MKKLSRLAADIGCVLMWSASGCHILHLAAPRHTLTGLSMMMQDDKVEAATRHEAAIYLRQTSFKTLEEDVLICG